MIRRVVPYLDKHAPAVSGQHGHNALMYAARIAVYGFDLGPDAGLVVLREHYNSRCQPPWSEKELEHKCFEAHAKPFAKPRGWLLYAPRSGGQTNSPGPSGDGARTEAPENVVKRIVASSVKCKPVTWLWHGWLPCGKLFCLDGDPNLGKSTVLLDIAARVTTSGVMPNNEVGPTGKVIILSAEDDIDDTIVPRLMAAGADLSQIEFLDEVGKCPPAIPRDLKQLGDMVRDLKARLVVIDPITAYLGVDGHKDQEVRNALHPLKKLAGETGCSFAYLRHLNKSGGTKAMYRGGGSIAIIAAARAAVLIAPHPDEEDVQVFAHTKWNLSTRQPSLAYTLEKVEFLGAPRVNWLPGTCTYNADDLLRPPKSAEDREVQASQKDRAIEWLKEVLAAGPRRVAELYELAAGLKPRIGESTLRLAKKELGVEHFQGTGSFSPSLWTLPSSVAP